MQRASVSVSSDRVDEVVHAYVNLIAGSCDPQLMLTTFSDFLQRVRHVWSALHRDTDSLSDAALLDAINRVAAANPQQCRVAVAAQQRFVYIFPSAATPAPASNVPSASVPNDFDFLWDSNAAQTPRSSEEAYSTKAASTTAARFGMSRGGRRAYY